jgi:hypothetical protein
MVEHSLLLHCTNHHQQQGIVAIEASFLVEEVVLLDPKAKS